MYIVNCRAVGWLGSWALLILYQIFQGTSQQVMS